jgi:uncharacterized protein YhbP (UPF0306 family)
MQKEDLQKHILDYMKNHRTISLATARDKSPYAATVFYVNVGFDIYFLSSPTSRHGEDLSLNPRVSGTIDEEYDDWRVIKGIQLQGRAEDIGGILKNEQVSKAYVKKFPTVADFLFSPINLGRVIFEKVGKVHFYRLTPSRLTFLNNELGFGHRDELIL